jgi:cytochrome c oxidase cbb3-type subunit IV
MGTFRGIVTLILLLAFVALVIWLASSRNKHRFDAAARLPLEDDRPSDTEPTPPTKHEHRQ